MIDVSTMGHYIVSFACLLLGVEPAVITGAKSAIKMMFLFPCVVTEAIFVSLVRWITSKSLRGKMFIVIGIKCGKRHFVAKTHAFFSNGLVYNSNIFPRGTWKVNVRRRLMFFLVGKRTQNLNVRIGFNSS